MKTLKEYINEAKIRFNVDDVVDTFYALMGGRQMDWDFMLKKSAFAKRLFPVSEIIENQVGWFHMADNLGVDETTLVKWLEDHNNELIKKFTKQ